MSHAHTPAAPGGFDEMDPHHAGEHGQHSGHVIVGPFMLRSVLIALLFFTFLTVGVAQAEVWLEGLIGEALPWWVNVVGAMSIAVVKSLLVMAIFMQLRYDNPLNSVLMAFTFAALAIFILMTGLDLFGRGIIDDFKAPAIVAGGSGRSGKPTVLGARERYMKKLTDQYGAEEGARKFEEIKTEMEHMHAGHEHVENMVVNSPNHTRPRTGITDVLSTTGPTVEGTTHLPVHERDYVPGKEDSLHSPFEGVKKPDGSPASEHK